MPKKIGSQAGASSSEDQVPQSIREPQAGPTPTCDDDCDCGEQTRRYVLQSGFLFQNRQEYKPGDVVELLPSLVARIDPRGIRFRPEGAAASVPVNQPTPVREVSMQPD